ncbi:MAG: hypothetical protein AAFV59_13460, partial [Pseudomonadota bacterium]
SGSFRSAPAVNAPALVSTTTLQSAFRAAVKVYHELQYDGEANDRARFRMRMIERVLTQFQAIPRDDLDYLLEKLDAYAEQAKQREENAA